MEYYSSLYCNLEFALNNPLYPPPPSYIVGDGTPTAEAILRKGPVMLLARHTIMAINMSDKAELKLI